MLAPYRGSPPPRAPTLLGSSLGTRERSCHTLNEPNTVLVSAKRSTTSSEVQSGRKAEIALIHSMEATEIALSPLRKAEGSEVSETEKGETFLRLKGHSAKREQGQCHGERARSPSTPCMNLPEKGMQVQPPPQIRWGWIWLLGSSDLTHPVPIPFQSKTDLLEQEMCRDKAALFAQPTLRVSREHINTLQCAMQGTLLWHRVADVLLIASSGESA